MESGNYKAPFILNRGIVTEATPWSQNGVVYSTLSKLLSARSVPCGWAYRPVEIDCKGQCLSACLPPRHPNSLWHSYRHSKNNRGKGRCNTSTTEFQYPIPDTSPLAGIRTDTDTDTSIG